VLDYEYYFNIVDAALKGDVSTVLMSFNEILEKGFDGHNFVSGLNSHLRDLLVSRDEVTLRLLEATPSVKQRYLQQAQRSPVEFLYRALEIASNCDIAYKSSKNQRLHVELALIRLCRITTESLAETEKKKIDTINLKDSSEEIEIPSKSEILRQHTGTVEKRSFRQNQKETKNEPAGETEQKSISIKDIISEESEVYEKSEADSKADNPPNNSVLSAREAFNPEKFNSAWKKFSEQVLSDGPRVASMFKSIMPELHPDNSIVIHLSNITQQDMFARNYKQKLTGFLEKEFNVKDVNVELIVDLTQTAGIIYSDEQKYNHLTSKNPGLKDIRRAFNLDFE
jgi:DNA polymerase-3 subunit gamma/tau